MTEIHLADTELACSKCGRDDARAAEHLRWCMQCRSAAAEYRWLGDRVGDALAAAAAVVDVPRPKWRALKRQLAVGRQRRLAGWRVSATASMALAMCAILSLSSVVGVTVVAQTLSPEAVMTPFSAATAVSGAHVVLGATPTPITSTESEGLPSAPALPPLPTPPDSDV